MSGPVRALDINPLSEPTRLKRSFPQVRHGPRSANHLATSKSLGRTNQILAGLWPKVSETGSISELSTSMMLIPIFTAQSDFHLIGLMSLSLKRPVAAGAETAKTKSGHFRNKDALILLRPPAFCLTLICIVLAGGGRVPQFRRAASEFGKFCQRLGKTTPAFDIFDCLTVIAFKHFRPL